MSVAIDAAPAESQPKTHPIGFFFIFWGEFAERCSYYGMRAILVLYMTSVFHYDDGEAAKRFSYFKAACYLLPLLGGFLADRFFGKYWTIVGFSVPYVLGHFILGVPNNVALFWALVLLACGSGVIKPNISTLMGLTYDQRRPGQPLLRSSAFLWFYFSINIGALLSQFLLPQLRDYLAAKTGDLAYAYQMTFLFPAILMVLALAAFASGKKFYAVEVLNERKHVTVEERSEQWKVLATLLGLFVLMTFFWAAYEQNDNLWTFFARDHVDRTVNFGLFQKTFAPDGFQFVNPLYVIIFVPLFPLLWGAIDPQARRFPPATKMLIGFVVTAASAAFMSFAAYQCTDGRLVSGWWIIAAYLILTIGEILVYGTGLELAYAAAPERMKGFITACFLLTNTLGNLVNTQWSPMYAVYDKKDRSWEFFAITAAVTLAASIAFYFVGRQFNRQGSTVPDQPHPL